MGISFRENLGLRDGFFDVSESSKLPIIRSVRKHQPEIVITNAIRDRHPDHGRASQLVSESCFLSGDRKSTRLNSSHGYISYAVFCLKKKNNNTLNTVVA